LKHHPLLPQFLSDAVELLARRGFITAAADRFKGFPFPNQGGGARRLALGYINVSGNRYDGELEK
jgi:hypothetical protein